MKALTDLFSTDYGLMSVVGIAMMLIGIAAFVVVVRRKMNEPPRDPRP
jgi:LPXTG-motif cell wall-anchored protein